MFDNLTALGYGLVMFAIVLGVGSIVLFNFGNATGGTANTTVQYLLTQMGSTSGGLASWTPAIIAVSVGFLFLAMFGFGGRRKK